MICRSDFSLKLDEKNKRVDELEKKSREREELLKKSNIEYTSLKDRSTKDLAKASAEMYNLFLYLISIILLNTRHLDWYLDGSKYILVDSPFDILSFDFGLHSSNMWFEFSDLKN